MSSLGFAPLIRIDRSADAPGMSLLKSSLSRSDMVVFCPASPPETESELRSPDGLPGRTAISGEVTGVNPAAEKISVRVPVPARNSRSVKVTLPFSSLVLLVLPPSDPTNAHVYSDLDVPAGKWQRRSGPGAGSQVAAPALLRQPQLERAASRGPAPVSGQAPPVAMNAIGGPSSAWASATAP